MFRKTIAIFLLCSLTAALCACGAPEATRPPLPANAEIIKRCMGRCQFTAERLNDFVRVEEQTPEQIKELLPGLDEARIADIAVFKETEGESAGFFCLITVKDKQEDAPRALEALKSAGQALYRDEQQAYIEKWNEYAYCFIGEQGGVMEKLVRQILMLDADARAMPTWKAD